jgi:hypothetical protein
MKDFTEKTQYLVQTHWYSNTTKVKKGIEMALRPLSNLITDDPEAVRAHVAAVTAEWNLKRGTAAEEKVNTATAINSTIDWGKESHLGYVSFIEIKGVFFMKGKGSIFMPGEPCIYQGGFDTLF